MFLILPLIAYQDKLRSLPNNINPPSPPTFLPSFLSPSLPPFAKEKGKRVGLVVLITCQVFRVTPTLVSDFLIKDEIHTPVNHIINLIILFFDVPRG